MPALIFPLSKSLTIFVFVFYVVTEGVFLCFSFSAPFVVEDSAKAAARAAAVVMVQQLG